MPITTLPTQTEGSLGQAKTDTGGPYVAATDVNAAMVNTWVTRFIELYAEIGKTDGSTVGSINEALGALVAKDVQNNLAGGAAPGIADDDVAGYSARSTWLWNFDGDVRVYVCADASTGDAKWIKLAEPASSGYDVTALVGADGTSDDFARADHQHAHAVQTDGTLHALAVASGTSGFMTGADKAKLDGIEAGADVTDDANVRAALAAATADIAVNARKLTGVADPTLAQDAATKAYVDALAQGISAKKSARVATAAAGTLASSFENGDTVDGVVLATGDRILIKDQAAPAENGIYVVAASGAPARATDFDIAAEVEAGAFVFVEEGTANADSGWVLTTDGAITVGVTSLAFVQFSGAGQISAGVGLTKTGNTIDADAATDTAVGVVELATVAEALAGTDTARAVTAAGLTASARQAPARDIAGASGALVAGDIGGIVTVSGGVPVSVEVPDLTGGGVFFAGRAIVMIVEVANAASVLTLTRAAGVTLDGAAADIIAAGLGRRVILVSTDGLAYFAAVGMSVAEAAKLATVEASADATAAASDTVAGKVELATVAETAALTDATRAVTPADLLEMFFSSSLGSLYTEDVWNGISGTIWASDSTGAGGGGGTGIFGTSGHPGVIRQATGTTTTGRGGARAAVGLPTADGAVAIDFIASVETLSTVGEEFAVILGLLSSVASLLPVGMFFTYDRLGVGLNWQCNTNDGTSTVTDSGVAVVAGAWLRFGIRINAGATSVGFYINGALVATHTTNLYTGGITYIGGAIIKSAGTTSRNWNLDFVGLNKTLTTPR